MRVSVRAISELDDVLERHGVDLSSAEVIEELDAALTSVASVGAAPLSKAEVAFLRANAGPHAAEVLDGWDPAVERRHRARATVARVAQAAAASMSIAEAALLLGVDRSRISHRLSQGTLWAFTMGRTRRIPRWQFSADGGLLPGLASVVAAIPEGITPQTIEAFMRAPLPELDGDAPVDYLAAGGNPRPVADFVAALGEW